MPALIETEEAGRVLEVLREKLGHLQGRKRLSQAELAEVVNRWALCHQDGDQQTTTTSSLSRAEREGASLSTLRRVARAASAATGVRFRVVVRLEVDEE